MKIMLGIAACALLAASLAASADPSSKPRYRSTGELCSTDEISGKVKDTYAGRQVRVLCRTELDWKMSQFRAADRELDTARWQTRRDDAEFAPPPLHVAQRR